MLTDQQRKELKTLDGISPKEQSEKYTGSRMYFDLGNELKAFVKEEAQRRHITQAKFIRDCIRAEMERVNEKSNT